MFIYNNQLNPVQLDAVNQLASLCREVDGSTPPLYPHILEQKRLHDSNVLYFQDNTLVGFLSVYFFYADACEVSVIVAPSHRRQGIAKQLLRTIMPLLVAKQMNNLIFSTPEAVNDEWLSRFGFIYHHSEYQMQRQSFEPILITKQILTVRKATEKDIPLLCHIDELCFPEEEDNMPVRFNTLLEENNYTILLAFRQGRAVAKAHIRWQEDSAILSDIAVLPKYQRQGLGSELLSYCINHALSRGTTTLVLDVETSNQNALNLYTRHGFKTINATDFWTIATQALHSFLGTSTVG
ncbi:MULTISPECIES: GNAT family N-acetyltransferase [Legionella]|uniref:N-acetyltransferase domain-containing protein n=1 Tax=Legionella maceachernii TaxID=466 RepID=A0A0W0VX62_9GAMM|nr:GNAT family N-acetyltransferase [Legionella maceachernii]KTD24278.1 hypothetical protein Lmac_3151 [Legionella maceachernii]SKA29248.1 Ribosomal protein S18 acetylase RimI [Legionella maceachernii]SUO98710.1 ribosomal-protein-alanine N-acetyltransferase [Legionella maceachernii]